MTQALRNVIIEKDLTLIAKYSSFDIFFNQQDLSPS